MTPELRGWCRDLPNVDVVTVAAGHFVPEDVGAEVAAALDAWLAGWGSPGRAQANGSSRARMSSP